MIMLLRLTRVVNRSVQAGALFVLLHLGVHASDAARQRFDLPAGDAASTLRQLSEASQREILFAAEVVRGVRTNAVRGELTALEAGNRMLSGTRLVAMQDEKSGALAVRRREVAAANTSSAAVASGGTSAPTATRAAGNAVLAGRVSNQATGASLEGAIVKIPGTRRSVSTERDGSFVLAGLASGSVTLEVSY